MSSHQHGRSSTGARHLPIGSTPMNASQGTKNKMRCLIYASPHFFHLAFTRLENDGRRGKTKEKKPKHAIIGDMNSGVCFEVSYLDKSPECHRLRWRLWTKHP